MVLYIYKFVGVNLVKNRTYPIYKKNKMELIRKQKTMKIIWKYYGFIGSDNKIQNNKIQVSIYYKQKYILILRMKTTCVEILRKKYVFIIHINYYQMYIYTNKSINYTIYLSCHIKCTYTYIKYVHTFSIIPIILNFMLVLNLLYIRF